MAQTEHRGGLLQPERVKLEQIGFIQKGERGISEDEEKECGPSERINSRCYVRSTLFL